MPIAAAAIGRMISAAAFAALLTLSCQVSNWPAAQSENPACALAHRRLAVRAPDAPQDERDRDDDHEKSGHDRERDIGIAGAGESPGGEHHPRHEADSAR